MQIKGIIDINNKIIPVMDDREKYMFFVENNRNKILHISFGREKKKRTIPENNYYWGVIVKILADYFGYTNDEMHETLKWQFLRIEQLGKPPKIRSTADESFSTKDAEEYYENIRRWALSEYQIYIPEPNEYE